MEELCKGELFNINEENDCDEKNEDMPEEMMLPKNCTLKKLQEIIHNIDSAKDKILADDPNLKRSLVIYQGIEKIAQYLKLNGKKKASPFKLLLVS